MAEALSETKLNLRLRNILRAQGLNAIHIREGDFPGIADLIVYQANDILAWAELKVDDEEVNPSQREFLRDQDAEAGNAYVLRYKTDSGRILVYRADAEVPMAVAKLTDNWESHFKLWREVRMTTIRAHADH